ncbi:unnamed protein product, partial [Ixodes pacificus]
SWSHSLLRKRTSCESPPSCESAGPTGTTRSNILSLNPDHPSEEQQPWNKRRPPPFPLLPSERLRLPSFIIFHSLQECLYKKEEKKKTRRQRFPSR